MTEAIEMSDIREKASSDYANHNGGGNSTLEVAFDSIEDDAPPGGDELEISYITGVRPGYCPSMEPDYLQKLRDNEKANKEWKEKKEKAKEEGVILCSLCREGEFEREYTTCGYLAAILMFPCGIICCLATRHLKCNRCGRVLS